MRVVARSSLTPIVAINCIREENGVTLVKYSAQQVDWVVQHDDPKVEVVSVSFVGQLWHLPASIFTQQSEGFESAREIGGVTIGVRVPILPMSSARNNRAGSFIGYSLSPVRTFQTIFFAGHLMARHRPARKFFEILETKNMLDINFHS